jgi:hypothetical protein
MADAPAPAPAPAPGPAPAPSPAPAPAPASAPAPSPAPASAPSGAGFDPRGWVPLDRFSEVNERMKAAEQNAATARAEAEAAKAARAELERKLSVTTVRAELGVDDEDDADRVLSAFDKAHAKVDAAKRPKLADWVRTEEGQAALPKSIKAAYGQAWSAKVQDTGTGGRQPRTSAGTAEPPASGAGRDPFESATPEQLAAALKNLKIRF